MPATPHVPDRLRRRVFRGSWAVRCGLLTPGQLRGPAWRQLFKDVYADRAVEITHALRARAAASLVVPGAVVTGLSAAVLWGVDLAGVDDDVELAVPPGAHPRRIPGVRVRRCLLPDTFVRERAGVLVTTPEATALRIAIVLPTDDAVAAIDRLVVERVVNLERFRALAAAGRGPGAARARLVAALADGLAQSPQETRLRLLLHRSRLPNPVAQHRIRDSSGFVAKVDFAWPEKKVAVEYDGLWHADPKQFALDRQRLNRLQAAGWTVVFVTAADLHRPEQLLARIAVALGV
jgi:very-short-patch-repair endonuclease